MNHNIVKKTKEKYLEYEQREQEILNAAINLFNEKGYRATTTADISRAAGISEPTMYKHFENKAALFMECFRLIIDQLLGVYHEIYINNRDDEVAYLENVAIAYFDFVQKNPNKSKFLIHLLSYQDEQEFDNAFNEFIEGSIERIARVLDSAKRKGNVVSDIDIRLSAAWFVSQYFTVISMAQFVDKDKFTSENIVPLVKRVLGIN